MWFVWLIGLAVLWLVWHTVGHRADADEAMYRRIDELRADLGDIKQLLRELNSRAEALEKRFERDPRG